MLAALIVIINNIYYDDAFYYTVSKAGQNSVFINHFYSLFSLMSSMCIYTSSCTPIAWRMSPYVCRNDMLL